MRCVACLQGDFQECRAEGNCGSDDTELELGNDVIIPDSGNGTDGVVDSIRHQEIDDGSDGEETEEEIPEPRTYKDDSALRDQQSTGRKRAARIYPLDAEAECDWKMRKNCGGGKFPITGCIAGNQEARHHGPDKNTLNNERGNVHRICHFCHNRWHTMNDPDYIWGAILEQHSPQPASIIDIAESEQFWQDKVIVKAKD